MEVGRVAEEVEREEEVECGTKALCRCTTVGWIVPSLDGVDESAV